MPKPQIKLKKRVTYDASGNTRLQIWVSETSDNIPPEILLFNMLPSIPDMQGPQYRYLGVCSYAEMINYPASACDDNSVYFRRASLDLLFEARAAAKTFWEEIQTTVKALLDEIATVANTSPAAETIDLEED